MKGQISLWDLPENLKPGDYVKTHGASISHIMRPNYVGQLVVVDKSTQSHPWFVVGILEAYIPYEDTYRSIVYIGKKQRQLITHRNGVSIYDVQPWDDVWEERVKKCRERQKATARN